VPATTLVVNTPATIAAGNLLVAYVYEFISTPSGTCSAPGWVNSYQFEAANGTAGQVAIMTRVATGTEGSTVTFTWTSARMAAIIGQFSGVVSLDGTPASTMTNVGATATAPSVTPTNAGDLLVVCYTGFASGFSTPAGMTVGPTVTNAGNSYVALFLLQLASTSPTGTINSTQSGGSFARIGTQSLLLP
jgi:hypothetical protein